jgi:hypothetical protein
LEKKVLELIRQAVEAGRIDAGKLKPNLSAKIPPSHSA